MRRWVLLTTVSLVILILALVGAGTWILRSTAGTAWLLDVASGVAGVKISTGQLEGRLADELRIGEMVVDWPDGQLTIKRLRLAWSPFSLLQQKLDISTLEVDQLVIHDVASDDLPETRASDENSTDFAAGDLAFLPGWLTVQIDHLQMRGISYHDHEGTAVIADELSGRYLWSQWRISASSFAYLSPYVNLRGQLDWDLQKPHLEMTANVHLPDTLIEPSTLQDITVPAEFPGQLSLDGDWNNFSGPVRFGDSKKVDDTLWLTADSQGSWQGIRFENLQGRYLNGDLKGLLDLSWIHSFRMQGELSGAGLDPGALVEELDGQAHLDLSGELLIPYDENPLRASIDGLIHEGHLHGHAIAGKLAAVWQDGRLDDLNLDLHSEDARVVAHGRPAERLDMDLDVTELSSFHPDLAGRMQASGWLRWVEGYLTGEMDGSCEGLIWQESSLAALSFHGRHLAEKKPLELKLDGQGLQYEEIQVDQLQLELKGSLENHDVRVVVDSHKADISAQLAGQYRDETWQAELKYLAGQTGILGEWTLESPAHLKWHGEELKLEKASLVSSRKERVTLEDVRWSSSGSGLVNLSWHELGHDWLAYLPSTKMTSSGRSSGQLKFEMAGQQPISLEARLQATAEVEDDLANVVLPLLTAEIHWRQDGLTFEINAESDNGEVLAATASSPQPLNLIWPPRDLSLDMHWQGVKLNRLNRFREGLDAQGLSEGHARLDIVAGELLSASARISAEGKMQRQGQTVGLRSLLAELDWDEKGFQLQGRARGIHDGVLALRLTSKRNPHFSWPDSGQIEMEISDLDLHSLHPLLPAEASFDGILHGSSSGYWQEDGRIFLTGRAGLAEGKLTWSNDEGQVGFTVQKADLQWQWQDEHLDGTIELLLSEKGQLRGSWQLPLPARWPVDFAEDGALQAKLQGQLRATGLLSAIAPGLIQDLQGQIASDLEVTGSWQDPAFSGRISLTDASAYLPYSGMTIENFKLLAVLDGDQIKVEDFSLNSGPEGILNGTGTLELDRWRLKSYDLIFNGENLQVYNFPEIQVFCSPKLTVNGDLEKIQVRGSLLVPEMGLFGASESPEFQPSQDVVVSTPDEDDQRALSTGADLQIVVELGEQVWFKSAGVETRLSGGATVTLNDSGQLATWGEISLVDGLYKAYGANLEIVQGLLKYSGGPITNPTLRIFAARQVGDVQAGVQITGDAEVPVVSLYSRPSMPERDIMGYIFMGRPMRVGREGEDAMMIGAGALMPYGDTFSSLGISEIDVQGLFDGTGGVRLRHRLAENLELESTLGSESGVDLYYIFKFD